MHQVWMRRLAGKAENGRVLPKVLLEFFFNHESTYREFHINRGSGSKPGGHSGRRDTHSVWSGPTIEYDN